MSQRGVALLVALVVLALASAVLVAVLSAAGTEITAARGAAAAIRVEADLLSLRSQVLVDPILDSARTGPFLVWSQDSLGRAVATAIGGPAGTGFWLEFEWGSDPVRRRMAMAVLPAVDSARAGMARPSSGRSVVQPVY